MSRSWTTDTSSDDDGGLSEEAMQRLVEELPGVQAEYNGSEYKITFSKVNMNKTSPDPDSSAAFGFGIEQEPTNDGAGSGSEEEGTSGLCQKQLACGALHKCRKPKAHVDNCGNCPYIRKYERDCGHSTVDCCSYAKASKLPTCEKLCGNHQRCSHVCERPCYACDGECDSLNCDKCQWKAHCNELEFDRNLTDGFGYTSGFTDSSQSECETKILSGSNSEYESASSGVSDKYENIEVDMNFVSVEESQTEWFHDYENEG